METSLKGLFLPSANGTPGLQNALSAPCNLVRNAWCDVHQCVWGWDAILERFLYNPGT